MLQKAMALCLAVVLLAAFVPAVAEDTLETFLFQEMSESMSATQAFAVQYATDLMSGEKNEELYGMFTDEVKAQFPWETFDVMWTQLTAAYGDFNGFGNYKFEIIQGYSTHYLQMNMLKQKLLIQLTLDSTGKVAGLFIKDGRLLDTPAEANAENQDYHTPAVSQENSTPAPAISQEIPIPAGIVEEEIIVGDGEWALPGTLTLPALGKNFPAVVLVHGSGPNNRDEAVGQTKMFRDLAWKLAQNGIASIRYDKRTLTHAKKFTFESVKTLTVREETIMDAVLAGKVLKADSRIDGNRIFVVGHSLGAMLGPRIAKEGEDLFTGMILINGSPLQLTDIILAQNEDLLAKQPEDVRKTFQLLVDMEVEKLKGIDDMTDDQLKEEIIFGMWGYYVKDLRSYDAAVTLKDLHLPTIIIQGGADFQVSLENGWEAWQAAAGGEAYITMRLYPELNHLLMKYTGDPAYQYSLQEYDTPARLDETAANDIAAWILEH